MKNTVKLFAVFLVLTAFAANAWGYGSIRDVYNWNAIHNLTLEDLNWNETERIHLPSGVTVLRGTWDAGPYTTYNYYQNTVTVDLKEVAVVYLPPGLGPDKVTPVYVNGIHIEERTLDINTRFDWVALNLGVAAIEHAQADVVVQELGLKDRNAMMNKSMQMMMDLNPCSLDDVVTGNFFLSLTRTSSLALTLISRLIEAEGGVAGKAAFEGYSKEGYTAWSLGAVDSRLALSRSGGYQLEDFIRSIDMMEQSNGCEATSGDIADAQLLYTFRNWLVESPAGQEWNRLFSVPNFKHLLYPNDFVVYGDVATYDLHDGRYYTLGADSAFLEDLTERKWRYWRKSRDYQPTPTVEILAYGLSHGENLDFVPKVSDAHAEMSGNSFRIIATGGPSLTSARLWWTHSEDRAFNDVDNPDWRILAMSYDSGLKAWRSPWITMPAGHQIAWWVEVFNKQKLSGYTVTCFDATTVRFLNMLPPLVCEADHFTCATTPPRPPVLIAPIGAEQDAQPLFKWQEVASADGYELVVDGAFQSSIGSDVCSGGVCSVRAPFELAKDTTFNWRMKACNSVGISDWSQTASFRIEDIQVPTVPAVPIPVSPSGTIYTTRPVFTWQVSPGADQYQIRLIGVGQVTRPASDCADGFCSFTCPVTLSKYKDFDWQIQAVNNVGPSGWSDITTFTVR